MKRKIFLFIGAVAIAATMVFTTNLGLSSNAKMSALTLANIEALAKPEGDYELQDFRYDWIPVPGGYMQCCVRGGDGCWFGDCAQV